MNLFFSGIGHAARILINAVLILAVVLALLLYLPKSRGIGVYAVLSSSMEPALPVGSIVYVKPCGRAEEIMQQDIIAYESGNSLVVHRVISVDREHEAFYTKGDFNKTSDEAPVELKNILGKVRIHIPYVGFVLMYLQKGPIRYLLIMSGTILVVLALPVSKKEEINHEKKME